jgi:hypothetical protein
MAVLLLLAAFVAVVAVGPAWIDWAERREIERSCQAWRERRRG